MPSINPKNESSPKSGPFPPNGFDPFVDPRGSKRGSRGRPKGPYRYFQKGRARCLWLTDHAFDWLQERGGSVYIETLAETPIQHAPKSKKVKPPIDLM